ncbi:hypothetical protein O6H91_12G057800 [Diphasiastrum complanatum]|uniref:Uncharacterized protein n=1 Tax=Diphasiastrum complanatum TaxID=34168 RepID=A0ACC2C2A4_DIPCM|nr:hypothetical protein O6H91_12G057800 [Diphasiastrum complanatum]
MACDSFLEVAGCDSPRASPVVGWLSPRISFSSNFAELDTETGIKGEAYDAMSTDFDFSMAMSNLNSISEGIMHTADELFYNGKLLPLQLSNQFRMLDSQSLASSHKEDTESPKVSDHHSIEEQKVCPALRQPSSSFCSSPPPAGARFAPPSPETPKCSIILRDLFGANKGQVNAIRESSGKLLTTSKVWKNLVKGVIAAGKRGAVRSSVSEESSKVPAVASDVKTSIFTSSHTTVPLPPVSSRIPCPTYSLERQQRIKSRDAFQRDLESVENSVSPGRILGRSVQRTGAASADDCNTFPSRKKALSYRSISMPSSRCTSPEHKSEKLSSGSTGRVNSGKIIMKNLERCSTNQKTPVKFQEQCNSMQHREYWRAPEKVSSYTSNVRVTPVLNVPVCMAPSVKNSKLAKGRFSSFKELLFSPKKETES